MATKGKTASKFTAVARRPIMQEVLAQLPKGSVVTPHLRDGHRQIVSAVRRQFREVS